jgi:hypothetical protein
MPGLVVKTVKENQPRALSLDQPAVREGTAYMSCNSLNSTLRTALADSIYRTQADLVHITAPVLPTRQVTDPIGGFEHYGDVSPAMH